MRWRRYRVCWLLGRYSMNAHSDIGPSSADRWINCPGSIQLSLDERAQKSETSKFAAEGTVAHSLIDEVVKGKVDELGLMARIGSTVEEAGHEVTIDEEMAMHVLEYVREVDAEIAEIKADHRTAPVWKHSEVRVALASVDENLWGTADTIVFRKGHILVVRDFKYGKGKRVRAEKNPQLAIYTLAAMETIAGEAFDEVWQVISQPRAGGTNRWRVDMDWLHAFKEEARRAIELSRQPEPPLKSGDWCYFCKAKSFCPEIQKTAAAETQVDFEKAPVPGALARAETMAPWKIARVLDHQDLIEGWLSSVRSLAQQMLESGQAVPGYKLVDGRSSRKWTDATGETAAARYQTEHGDKVFVPRKVKSVAQMEALVGKKNLETSLYEVTSGHKKVANDNDPRPETVSSAQSEFMSVTPNDPFLGRVMNPPILQPCLVDPATDPFFAAPAPRVVEPEVLLKRGPIWPV